MKTIQLNLIFMIMMLTTLNVRANTLSTYSVDQVWDQVTSDQYELPNNKISFLSLFSWGTDLIKKAANRTLNDRSDILNQFDKLAHPNGVCLKGTWKITEENIYSGLFKDKSEGIMIARASTALSNTKRGDFRSFGFAGKLFNTNNGSAQLNDHSANFFLVDDLGGTMARNYTGVEMSNEPAVTNTSAVMKALAYALKLKKTFGEADSNPGMRQLYEISEMGERDLTRVITPKWMKISVKNNKVIDEADFRNELNVNNYSNNLVFSIVVANEISSNGAKNWKEIGTISFKESVVSNSCDHRLHFHHPKWKTNLKHK